ncbi:bifunctional YncE family protein/alkaline phosphatase family protein [Acidithiobacillus sp.]|uniref:bifunctional YncE family protein/alkaline phosphatase family protein n=1 Tax=Acidithiobacillus sp. TaxID=1872118 RepID=UPI0025C3B78B|nr:bifunctional YncE family protein/alkaline phosphatase family protein [Acidithiobacillus sp.]
MGVGRRLLGVVLLASAVAGCAHTGAPKGPEQPGPMAYAQPLAATAAAVSAQPLGQRLPTGQVVRPAGEALIWGDKALENHAIDLALSPDGKRVAILGRFDVALFDVASREMLASYAFATDVQGLGTYGGVAWSADGREFYVPVSQTDRKFKTPSDGAILGFRPERDAQGRWHLPLPRFVAVFAPERDRPALPTALTPAADGRHLLVALNGQTAIARIDPESGRIQRLPLREGRWPSSLTEKDGRIFVTEWAGLPPKDLRSAGFGGWNDYALKLQESVRVDGTTDVAREGFVEVLGADGQSLKRLQVGLSPIGLTQHPERPFVYVADAGSDTVSVIDTQRLEVVERIPMGLPGTAYGVVPTAILASPDGEHVLVALGRLNALAWVRLGRDSGGSGAVPRSRVEGYVPVGEYPTGLAWADAGRSLWVTNLEGFGPYATVPSGFDKAFRSDYPRPGELEGFGTDGSYNAHRQQNVLSVVPWPPSSAQLLRWTQQVTADRFLSAARSHAAALQQLPRPGVKPRPIPERLGEPSVFHHVVYIIKENRTYDQVLGDLSQGQGDPQLTVFGRSITPNHHALAEEFALLDQYFLPAKSSAEGHPWATTAFLSDYVQRNVRAWFRGYPHTILDALVPPKTGYLWDAALARGLSVRIYGEATLPVMAQKHLTWLDLWQLREEGRLPEALGVEGTIPAVLQHGHPLYPGEDYRFSDQFRADLLLQDLARFEAQGQMPNLLIVALPNDHTAGMKPYFPQPQAMMADNDLALGRIVEALSRSRFWSDTVIFVTEDDAQDGWDHLSPFRSLGYVISPYSRLGRVEHHFYSQLDMLRTMEQILGIAPMNLMDLAARPMMELFGDRADLRPYQLRPATLALDTMNPVAPLAGRAPYRDPLGRELYAKALAMAARIDDPDQDELMNRMIWYAVKGTAPYPVQERRISAKDD